MSTRRRRSGGSRGRVVGVVGVGLLGLLCGLGGCQPDTTWIDKTADELVTALQEKDGPKFERLASKGLEAKLGASDREGMGDVIQRLGALQRRERSSVVGKAGEVQRARYRLGFVRGEVELEVTLDGSEVAAFAFEGAPLEMARKEVGGTRLEAGELVLFDGEGRPHEGTWKVGEPVRFEVPIRGMRAHKGAWWLRGDLEVQDDKRHNILSQKDVLKVKLDASSGLPLAKVTGTITLTRPGRYRFRLRLRDQGIQDKALRKRMKKKPLEVRGRFELTSQDR